MSEINIERKKEWSERQQGIKSRDWKIMLFFPLNFQQQ
jgi:hypothetical protein